MKLKRFKKTFIRRETTRHPKLKNRRKNIRWRKPRGRDNKMRLRERGYPKVVSVGYKKPEKEKQKEIIKVNNIKDLMGVKQGQEIKLGKIGKKKKLKIATKAKEKKIKILNLNINKFLKEIEKEKLIRIKRLEKEMKEKGKVKN